MRATKISPWRLSLTYHFNVAVKPSVNLCDASAFVCFEDSKDLKMMNVRVTTPLNLSLKKHYKLLKYFPSCKLDMKVFCIRL